MNCASFPLSTVSRLGPTVAVDPAALKVWQLAHGGCAVFVKNSLPFTGSPLTTLTLVVPAWGTVPITVSGVGVTVVSPPQPATRAPRSSASRRRRCIGREA